MLKLIVPVGLVPPLKVAVSWIVPPAVCVAVALVVILGDALITVVVAVAVLLAWLLSAVDELTVAVLVIAPASDAVTVMVIGGAAPGGRLVGCVQVTLVFVPLQIQPVPEALWKITPAGSVSVTVIGPAAVDGPALLTLRV